MVVTAVAVPVVSAVPDTTVMLVANVSWNVPRIVPVRYVVLTAAVVAVEHALRAKAAVLVPANPTVHPNAIPTMARIVVRVSSFPVVTKPNVVPVKKASNVTLASVNVQKLRHVSLRKATSSVWTATLGLSSNVAGIRYVVTYLHPVVVTKGTASSQRSNVPRAVIASTHANVVDSPTVPWTNAVRSLAVTTTAVVASQRVRA